MKTAFLEACTGSSEALQCMCHIVWRIQTLSMDSRRKKKKLQHQIKMFFYPQLPDRCLFFARNKEKYCQVDFYTSNTMWKHTLLYSRNNSTRSVQVEAYKTDRLVTPFHWRKKRLSSGKCLLNSIYVNLTNIFSKPDEYISIYCWRSSG